VSRVTGRGFSLAWVALIGVWFLWGSTYIGIRYAVETIPPFLMAGSRYVLAGSILLAVLALSRRTIPRIPRRQLLSTAIAGGAMLLGGNGLLSFGEQHLHSGVAALLVATVPLVMIVESGLVRHRGIAGRSIVAIVLGTAGVLILVGTPGSAINYGSAAIVLVGSFFWASGSIYATIGEMPSDPLLSTGLQMFFGGLLLTCAAVGTGEVASFHIAAVTTTSFLGWLWLIGPGAIVGFSAYSYSLQNLPTSTVATYAYVNPVVAVILGAAIGDQPLTVGLLVGGTAVILAVAVTLVKRRERVPEASVSAEGLAEIA
jgi:drug/metabolite transporter (DMT)-like permease